MLPFHFISEGRSSRKISKIGAIHFRGLKLTVLPGLGVDSCAFPPSKLGTSGYMLTLPYPEVPREQVAAEKQSACVDPFNF
jgi:hypothetical protein